MDIITALEGLKKLELKIQDLYSHYRKLTDTDKETSGFFYELSLEEKSHADLIDYQLRTIKKNRQMFNDVEFDLEPINKMIAEVESKICSKGPLSLKEAVESGIELETNVLEYHYKTLLIKSNPEVEKLIKSLGIFDKEHLDKLRTLAKSRGYSV